MCEKEVFKGYSNALMKSFGRLFNRSCAVKAEKLRIVHGRVDIDGSNIHGSGGSSSSSSSLDLSINPRNAQCWSNLGGVKMQTQSRRCNENIM